METKEIKFLKWEVNLQKVDDKNFSLLFNCLDNSGKSDTRNIKINEKHKGSNIGLICKELYDLNHLKWIIEVGVNSSLYHCQQPDLMLESELLKAKKHNKN